MSALPNPALPAFVAELGDEFVLAQVHLRRGPDGHELRHVDDRAADPATLRWVEVDGLRALAQTAESGAFRPLRAAPTLRRGWRARARNPGELERALDHLYPGGVADWFAARTGSPPVTHYREFAGRQTGMYRITTMLSDAQAAAMIRSCCAPRFCLKRRLWTVEGLSADPVADKSPLPCLEPCAVLLEFARKAARIEQEEKVPVSISASELDTLRAALKLGLNVPAAESVGREADFGAPGNPRRIQLLLEKTMTWGNPADRPADNQADRQAD